MPGCLVKCVSSGNTHWKRLAFESVDWVKQRILTQAGGPHSICWGPDYSKREGEGWVCSLPELSAPDSSAPGSWALQLGPGLTKLCLPAPRHLLGFLDCWWDLTSLTSLVLRPSDLNWTKALAFLVLQLVDGSSWDSVASIITWANS